MDLTFILQIVLIFVKVFVVTYALFLLPVPLTWIERKVAGSIQVRLGPYRVGPHGILQPFADTIKMFFKENIVPSGADKFLFKIAPIIALAPVCAVFVVIPFGDDVMIPIINKRLTLYISDMNVGVIYALGISGIGVYGMIFGGWASNSKYALMGGLRAAAQMISYEVAMTFAVVGVVMLSNTLSLVGIVKSQSAGFFSWNIWYLPVGPVWFIIYFLAGLAEVNRIPFDMPEDEGSLAAGYFVEYSGMRFAFFALAEYVAMVSVSAMAVVFFFGGWAGPFPTPIPPIVWFFLKTAALVYLFMWVRFTLPRYRYDQLMAIGWKVLIPVSLVTLLVTGLMRIYI